MISSTMSRLAFAAEVVKQLEAYHISCVLVGGACVSFYTHEKYVSDDLDFISPYSQEKIASALAEIGFVQEKRYFVHPNAPFYVEFPSGPIALGHRIIDKPKYAEEVDGTKVYLLSPTESVMDRLSAWYHWKDRRSLFQAIDIVKAQKVDLSEVRAWSKEEGEEKAFAAFLAYCKKAE